MRVALLTARRLRLGALHRASFSSKPPRKSLEEAKAEREPEYPIMLVNPRAGLGDAVRRGVR